MAKKVIAYMSDIVLGSTGEVIHRESQREAIRRHAEENGYEIVALFDDDAYVEDVLARPGIQRLLACDLPYDCLLVERIWALSRTWARLAPFLNEMHRRGRKIESALCLWDCVSQRARWYFRRGSLAFASAQAMSPAPAIPEVPAVESVPAIPETPAVEAAPAAPLVRAVPERARVKEPPRLNFVQLCRRLAPV
jgi:hypothetical protein